jgi:hypothetical protein
MPAVVGAEHDVLDTDIAAPLTTITKFIACVEISRYTRPEALKYFVILACVVSVVSYLLTVAF